VKRTSLRARTASTPSATAMWVLPTPGLPTRTTFSAASRNLSVARSSTTALGMEGWKEKSKSASVLTNGKPAARTLRSVPRRRLASASSEVMASIAEAKSASPAATADIQWGSPAAMASSPSSERFSRMRA